MLKDKRNTDTFLQALSREMENFYVDLEDSTPRCYVASISSLQRFSDFGFQSHIFGNKGSVKRGGGGVLLKL